MGILTDAEKPGGEQRELESIENWGVKPVTGATDKYGGIYRDGTIVCSGKFCNVLLNY